MPNWCLNSIYIEGPEKEIEKFEEYVSTNKSTFSLHKIIPMPDKEKENWYEWCWENWGTKWEIDERYIEKSGGNRELQYMFDTAWAPPVPVYEHLVNKFPKLIIEWFYQDESEEEGHTLPELSPSIFILEKEK